MQKSAFLHIGFIDEFGLADGNDKDISLLCDLFDIPGLGMADCDSAIFSKEQQSHWFSNNIASAKYDTVFAGDFNARAL